MIRAATLTLAVLFVAVPAYAQFDFFSSENTLTISYTPLYPKPGDEVTLRVTSPIRDLRDAEITWRGNGAAIGGGLGATETKITAGEVGKATTVGVTVTGEDFTETASVEIVPAVVHLVWEADSYTPPFYEGRALPVRGSTVRLLAIPKLSIAGREIPAADLIYTWRVDGTVRATASGRGKMSFVTSTSVFSDVTTVQLTVASADRRVNAESSVRIVAADPAVRLYEDHPLFGTMYHRAFSTTMALPETEATFVATPYFIPASAASEPRLRYRWRVNRTAVTPHAERPYALTINAANSSGKAFVEVAITHADNYFFDATGAWTVHLQTSSAAAEGDPFRR